MARRASRTRRVMRRAAIVWLVVWALLSWVTGRPGVALAIEMVAVVVLWVLYAGRFALDDPRALTPELWWFRAGDRRRPMVPGAVVFTGSSTIAHWSSLVEDFAPLPVVNRGISGAGMRHIAFFAERLVLPYAPRAVVLYAGENDLAGDLGRSRYTPEDVLAGFQRFCAKLHAHLPTLPIFYISIKPAKRRSSASAAFLTANTLIRTWCATDRRLGYIDATPLLLDAQGRPRSGIYAFDGIHLNETGYDLLTSVVRPYLEAPAAT